MSFSPFLKLKNYAYKLVEPSQEPLDKHIHQQIIFLNCLLLTYCVMTVLLFFFRLTTLLIEQSSHYQLLLASFFWIPVSVLLYIAGRLKYRDYMMPIIFLVPLITPWISLNIYLTNINADQFMVNMAYCSVLAVYIASIFYSKKKTFFITLFSLLHLSFFYVVVLKYPISWLPSKIYLVVFVAIYSMLKMDQIEKQTIELQKSQDRYKILFEESPISIWEEDLSQVKMYLDNLLKNGVKDLEKYLDENPEELTNLAKRVKVIDVNHATIEMYKAKGKHQLISEKGMNLVLGERSKDVFKKALISKLNNEKVFASDQVNYDVNGNPFDIYLRSANVSTKGWDMSIVSITDISKFKELEDRRNSFIQITSHELRTPLTVMKGFFELLNSNKALSEEQKEKCNQIIAKNIKRLNKLINEVSDIAKVDRGLEIALSFKSHSLCDFFGEKRDEYTNLLGNQFQFHRSSPKQDILSSFDIDRLNQVLDNLLTNSIKNTDPKNRLIMFKVNCSFSKIVVKITDNGAGIEPENLEKIFEQFISIPTQYSAVSTGIGLFISRKIIEAHNGTLTASSGGLDKGSTFTIELPSINN